MWNSSSEEEFSGVVEDFAPEEVVVEEQLPAPDAIAPVIAWSKISRREKTAGGDPASAPEGSTLFYAGGDDNRGHSMLASDDTERDLSELGLRYLGWTNKA